MATGGDETIFGASGSAAPTLNALTFGLFSGKNPASVDWSVLGPQYEVEDPNLSGIEGATALASFKSKQGAPQSQAAQLSLGGQQQWADAQTALYNQLAGIASGTGTSPAQLMLQQAQESALRQTMAAAQSQGGANYGAGIRAGLGAMGEQQLQGQQQMGALRAQEQQQALGQMASLAGQARGQEFDVARTQAEFQQQTALANAQLQVQMKEIERGYMDMVMRGEMSIVEAEMAIQAAKQSAYEAHQDRVIQLEIADVTAKSNQESSGFL